MPRTVLRLHDLEPVDAYVVASATRFFISARSVILPGGALPFVGLCAVDYGQEMQTCVIDRITAKRCRRTGAPHAFDITIEAVRPAETQPAGG